MSDSDDFEKIALLKFSKELKITSRINDVDETFTIAMIGCFNEFHLTRILYDYYFDACECINKIEFPNSLIYKDPIKEISDAVKTDKLQFRWTTISDTNIDIFLRLDKNHPYYNDTNYTIKCEYHNLNVLIGTYKYYIENNTNKFIIDIINKYYKLSTPSLKPIGILI